MRFDCSRCGYCCNTLGKGDAKEISNSSEERVNTIPPVLLNPHETRGLYLNEWDYKRLRKLAEEMHVKAEFAPNSVVYDLLGNRSIILDWIMLGEKCAFFQEKKCIIYEERPIECRRYPLLITPIKEGSKEARVEFNKCPSNKIKEILHDETCKQQKIDAGKIILLQRYFKDTYFEAYQSWKNDEFLTKALKFMVDKGIIKPALNYPLKFLKKRIDKSKKMGIFDFLISKGVMQLREYDKIVSDATQDYRGKKEV